MLNIKNKKIFQAVAAAILIKFFLFIYLVTFAPQSRFVNDSSDYLESAKVLVSTGAFATVEDGVLVYRPYRTPGYPFFLAVLQGALGLPVNAIILVQILLTLLAAFIVYRCAIKINPETALLSALIILYDPSISIFSLIILTETLAIFLMSLFMFAFILYLKNTRGRWVVVSALLLAAATYVRPVSYYLASVVAIFIVYVNLRFRNVNKAVVHALVFFFLVSSVLGIWESRNYRLTGQRTFSNVIQGVPSAHGLGKSFSRNKDSLPEDTQPAVYYLKTSLRSFLSLMTRPGPFKYFRSSAVSVLGKIFAYPWMLFWFAGFIIGVANIKKNIYYQFVFLVAFYFIFVSIGGVGLLVGERHRVPIMPFIAVISAFGWSFLKNRLSKYRIFFGQPD